MIKLELAPGIHRLPPITEPTRIVSTERWRAVLEPMDGSRTPLHAKATCRVEGCQMRFGTTDKGDNRISGMGIGALGDHECRQLRLDDCWIHNNLGSGVFTHPECALRMHRCLVERNGTHTQFDHGAYAKGWFHISNCLFLHNASYEIHAYPGESKGVIYRSVCYGNARNRTIVHGGEPGTLAVIRCTLFGDLPENVEIDDSNLCYPESVNRIVGQGEELVRPEAHLFFPRDSTVKAGAYGHNPKMDRFSQAEALWRSGFMDGWGENTYVGNPEMGHKYPFPMFPGDPYP